MNWEGKILKLYKFLSKISFLFLFASILLTGCSATQTVQVNSNIPTNQKVSNKTQVPEKSVPPKVNSNSEEKSINKNNSVNPTGTLKVNYLDVGQADCILLQQGNKTMLIDAGNNEDAETIINYLKRQKVSKLDVAVFTHPHEDHIGAADAVVNTFTVNQIIMPKASANTKTFRDLLTAIRNKGLKITTPLPSSTFMLGSAKCTILAPNSSSYEDLNNFSVVLKVNFGKTNFLFEGDAEDISEKEILAKGFDVKADVLKVGHHGSYSSTTQEYLNRVNPKYAVISVGKDNTYGHPHRETMQKLQAKGIKIYRTDQYGTVVAISDGNTITFSKGK